MRKAFCDRCGKEIKETDKDFVEKMRGVAKWFISSFSWKKRKVEIALYLNESDFPCPAELCEECEDSLKKWFEEGAKK